MFDEILAELSWQTAIDILFMAFCIYRLLLIIRGTRAVQMLFGLLILMLATFAAKWADLRAMHWLLQNIWTIWVLAAIILFQPELRRALAQVGHQRFFEAFHRMERGTLIEEVVRAGLMMSSKRMGALIVFEGETKLEGYIEAGTQLDAVISRELFLTIFNTRGPLHDGAVIISGGKIALAGCFLPLASEQQHPSKELGTRHRAAIGLTEETDAVVMVVSEETGGISVSQGGSLKRDLDSTELRRHLEQLLAKQKRFFFKAPKPDKPEPKRLKQ
ncbi:MAG: TIGR00159 family protein [Candidatus Schekmanbacteria bacterium]|nr:TIGR00159 family protein [Candidatus Schekmanbacteria bacterium]